MDYLGNIPAPFSFRGPIPQDFTKKYPILFDRKPSSLFSLASFNLAYLDIGRLWNLDLNLSKEIDYDFIKAGKIELSKVTLICRGPTDLQFMNIEYTHEWFDWIYWLDDSYRYGLSTIYVRCSRNWITLLNELNFTSQDLNTITPCSYMRLRASLYARAIEDYGISSNNLWRGFDMTKALLGEDNYCVREVDGLLLLKCGDVESNPGPAYNLKITLKEKLDALARARLRAEQKQKTQLRNIKLARKEMKRSFQIGCLSTVKEFLNPSIVKGALYGGLSTISPNLGAGVAMAVEMPKVSSILNNVDVLTQQVKESIPGCLDKLSGFTELASQTMTILAEISSKVSESLSSSLNTMQKYSQSFQLLTSIVALIMILTLPKKYLIVPIVALVLYYFRWPSHVVNKIISFFSPQLQIGIEDLNINLIGQMMFTLISFFSISCIPTDKFYDTMIRRLDLIPKAMTGMNDIWNKAGTVFEIACKTFKDYVGWKEDPKSYDELTTAEKIERWASRVNELKTPENILKLAKTRETVEEVKTLYNQMSSWMHVPSVWKSLNFECKAVLIAMRPAMNDLFVRMSGSNVHEGGVRKKPLCIYLSGDSGRGKSQVLIPLAYNLLKHRDPSLSAEQMANEIYNRLPECEYWDRYTGQRVVVCDDAFQLRDGVAKPNPELMEAIRMNNTAAAQVHCADLNDKGRFFTSEVVIYTSNVTHNFKGIITSMHCPEAAVRRLDMNCFRILTDPSYECEKIYNGVTVRRLDPTKLGFDPQKVRGNCLTCTQGDLSEMSLYYANNQCNHYCKKCEEQYNQALTSDHPLEAIVFCPHHYLFQEYSLFDDTEKGQPLDAKSFMSRIISYDQVNDRTEDLLQEQFKYMSHNPMRSFQVGNSEEEIFFDAVSSFPADRYEDGVVDLANAQDYVSFKTLELFIRMYAQTFPDQDLRREDVMVHFDEQLVQHKEIFQLRERLMNHGYMNKEEPNTTLYDTLNKCGVVYNFNACFYQRKTDSTWLSIQVAFSEMLGRLRSQLRQVWEIMDLDMLLNTALMGITMFSLSAIAYRLFVPLKSDEFVTAHSKARAETHQANMRIMCDIDNLVDDNAFESWSSTGEPDHKQQKKTALESWSSTGEPDHKQQKKTILESWSSTGEPDHKQQKKTVLETNGVDLLKKILSPEELQTNDVQRLMAYKEEYDRRDFNASKDPAAQSVLNTILTNNAYLMHTHVMVNGEERYLKFGTALAIKGSTFLMPYHFIAYIRDMIKLSPQHQIHFSSIHEQKSVSFTVEYMMSAFIRLSKRDWMADAVLLPLDPIKTKTRIVCKDIAKHFMTMHDQTKMTENDKYQAKLLVMNSVNVKKNAVLVPIHIPIVDACPHLDEADSSGELHQRVPSGLPVEEVIKFRQYWTYTGGTEAAYCGAPLIIYHPGVAHKIAGIHCMGDVAMRGWACVVTQEMLKEGFDRISMKYQCCMELPPVSPIGDSNVPTDANLHIFGDIVDKVSSGGDSKITPSVLYDSIVDHKTKPTITRPRNGINPIEIGLRKYGKSTPYVNPRLIELCVKDTFQDYKVNEDIAQRFKRVLTMEEAIKGVENEDFIPPINRKTSLGYPYAYKWKGEGKKDAFGHDDWTLDTEQAKEIITDTENLIKDCANGIQRGVFWTDTPKDERRPIEKVNMGKTRMFAGSPVHIALAIRMYFIGFSAALMTNRNENGISVGSNMFSIDPEIIVKRLRSKGRTPTGGCNVMAGDYANYDGSLLAQILWCLLEYINAWYNDGPENAMIRYMLWSHVVNAVHLCGSTLWQATHCIVSGFPLTAPINSCYGRVLVRLGYMICALQYEKEHNLPKFSLANMEMFNKYVVEVCYGDDNLIAVSELIKSWFNQVTLTAALLTIGHVYTDETKSGNIVHMRDISEVCYLKRKFKFCDILQRHVAPLDLDVILEIPQWTKKGTQEMDITVANVDVALRELSLHGKEVFEKWATLLEAECNRNNVPYRFMTWEHYYLVVNNMEPEFELGKVQKVPKCWSIVTETLKTSNVPGSFSVEHKTKRIIMHAETHHQIVRACQRINNWCFKKNIKLLKIDKQLTPYEKFMAGVVCECDRG